MIVTTLRKLAYAFVVVLTLIVCIQHVPRDTAHTPESRGAQGTRTQLHDTIKKKHQILNRNHIFVVVLDDDHLVHVPMSFRARTSALDLWLELKGSRKVY